MYATNRKGIWQMALCSALWSISGVFIKMIPWNAMIIAGFRSLIGACVIALYMLVSHRRFLFNRKVAWLGFTVAVTCTLFIIANKLTSAANAIVLQYTAPVFLLAYELLFHHRRFRPGDYLAVLLTVTGVALFFFDRLQGGALLGNLIAILSGATFAATMFTVAGVDEDTRMNGIMHGHFLAALVGVPFLFVYGAPVSAPAISALLILGILQLGIPYILYGLAASNCTALALTLLAALEPILNPIWVFLVFQEKPGNTALLGGLLVLVSVTLWCVWDARLRAAAARVSAIS